jgi:DNA repair exonuclease SbcCD ATPase subunit
MKNIQLKSLTLVNFKGERNRTVNLGENTTIAGRNEAGKTTIMDSFLWVLFGKDSTDRKDFAVKTLDAFNKEIPKIEHYVEAVLDIDGMTIKLKRLLEDDWRVQRGTGEEIFYGNKTSFYVDDVPLKANEYKAKIDGIVSEDIFKIITNPLYFNSLPWKIRRGTIIDVAGGIDKKAIANRIPEYQALLDRLTNKTVDEYKKEVAEKKKKLKEDIKLNNAKIQEKERDLQDELDYTAIELEISSKQKELELIESKINDVSKAYEAEYDKVKAKKDELRDLNSIIYDIERDAQGNREDQLNNYSLSVERKQDELRNLQSKKQELDYKIKEAERQIESKRSRMDELRGEWNDVNSQGGNLNVETNCPACGQQLPKDNIEEAQKQAKAKFINEKERKLNEIEATGERLKNEVELGLKVIENSTSEIASIDKRIKEADENKVSGPEIPTVEETLAKNTEYQELLKKRDNFQIPEVKEPDFGTLKDEKAARLDELQTLKSKLSLKATYDNHRQRKSELENEVKQAGQQIADLEKDEFAIEKFDTLYMEEVGRKVNAMFTTVQFKMFNDLINGGFEETCEAMVNGVPFSDLNSAAKINAGLEIIKVLSEYYEVMAPVFIDNSETILNPLKIPSQTILLQVTNDEVLTIK